MSGSGVGMGGAAAVVIAVAPEDRGARICGGCLVPLKRNNGDDEACEGRLIRWSTSETRVIISSVRVFSA